MGLLRQLMHRLRHSIEEKGFSLLLVSVTIGSGNQFLGLGHGERGKEIGKDGF